MFKQPKLYNAEKLIEKKDKLANTKSKEFFYSEALKEYVALQPLKVDDRIVRAANELEIDLNWDDEGNIVDISWLETRKLADKIGAKLLSPSEYWKAYNEAIEKGDSDTVEQLQSDRSTEWLDVVFEKDEQGNVFMIEHPEIIGTSESFKYEGERKKVNMPDGRPGWFDPKDNIDFETGLPLKVDSKREKGTLAWSSATWKYWSVFKVNEPVAAIRGYVTSSGTPSFDCDIPLGAKQPVLMMRECRKELLESVINPELMQEAKLLIESYKSTTVDKPAAQNPNEHEVFYNDREKLFDFLTKSGNEFVKTKDKEAQKVKEKFLDMLGAVRIMAKNKNDQGVAGRVDNISNLLFGLDKKIADIASFSSFALNSKIKLKEALAEKKRIVFVMGHKNPDSDTVISSLAEAYRNSLMDKDAVFIPVVQGARMPDEIRRLLGEEISDSIMFTEDLDYDVALKSGQARWILVDQNISEVQRFAISIVDHHILSEKAKRQDISKTWEMAGSTTALIVQKFHGMGFEIDKELARILYGATLMDTEDRSDKKMTYKDGLIMNDLKKISGIENDKKFYQDLMSHLLNTDDAELLFNRDYKQDWGIFGFAVAKIKGGFDEKGNIIKKDLLDRLANLADKNNKDKNFPLTIVKVADYLEDNETINRERIYMIFNEYVLPEFKETMFGFLTEVIKNEFENNKNFQIEQTENSLDFWGTGDQLSRKVTAPFLEPIVEAFNKFYYSPSTKLFVKREFLKMNQEIQNVAKNKGIELSIDREGRINNITYNEAKQLLDSLGLTAMSLSEYWKILKEAEESHDEQMLKHLRSSGFVEFLDTIILDKNKIIDHPEVIKTEGGYNYKGEKREINIPNGVPGLIYPESINLDTGFPNSVENPRNYGDKRVWRYWSPDADVCIPTRGHIFLLNQPSFDMKIHPDDALPNLGIRPCCKEVKPPVVEIKKDENGVSVKIEE